MNRLFDILSIKEEDGRIVRYGRGSEVEDRRGDETYVVLVLSGIVGVYSTVSDDRRVLINKLGKGEVFGIANLFLEDELGTIIECEEESTLFFFPKDELRKRIISSPEASAYYCTLMNEKLQFLTGRISALSASSSRSRVALALLDGVKYRNLEELSYYLNISRATLFRELSFLSSWGAIERKGRQIIILDRDRLSSFL